MIKSVWSSYSFPEKYFTQIYRALYRDAILVPIQKHLPFSFAIETKVLLL